MTDSTLQPSAGGPDLTDDRKLADAVRCAAQALCDACAEAARAGLTVQVRVHAVGFTMDARPVSWQPGVTVRREIVV